MLLSCFANCDCYLLLLEMAVLIIHICMLQSVFLNLGAFDCVGCRLNEEMIETLFIVNTPNSKPKDSAPRSSLAPQNLEDRVLDPKKSQNIAILLRALNVTIDEVCDALLEGNFLGL